MSYNYSNYTRFGMKSEAGRYTLVVWYVLVILCSLLGDTVILLTSVRYRAFQLHRVVVSFIQHIAVCDLFLSAVQLIPNVVSLVANHQVSSDTMCIVRFSGSFYGNTASLFLVSSMAASKLLLIKYPLRAGSWSRKAAHKVCAGIWFVSLYIPGCYLIVDKDDVIFDYRTYNCMYGYSSSIWKILLPISALTIVVPNLVIIGSSVLLLKEARRVASGAQRDVRWQGIITVVLTASVYSISFGPYTIYCIAEPFVRKDPVEPGPFYLLFYRLACAFVSFNILSNFLIYSLTVNSFRHFLTTKLYQIIGSRKSYQRVQFSSTQSNSATNQGM